MGSFFRVNVVQNRDLSDFLVAKKKEAKIFAATLSGKIHLNQIAFPKKTIIIFGNESRGIRPEILSLADFEFKIEGEGSAESLNVAISAGIVLYKYFLSQNEKK
jgi:tRNA G18 (ribose-2'-O)-methylase SpoU